MRRPRRPRALRGVRWPARAAIKPSELLLLLLLIIIIIIIIIINNNVNTNYNNDINHNNP